MSTPTTRYRLAANRQGRARRAAKNLSANSLYARSAAGEKLTREEWDRLAIVMAEVMLEAGVNPEQVPNYLRVCSATNDPVGNAALRARADEMERGRRG